MRKHYNETVSQKPNCHINNEGDSDSSDKKTVTIGSNKGIRISGGSQSVSSGSKSTVVDGRNHTFTLLSDGTAIDNTTKIMWSRCNLGAEFKRNGCTSWGKKFTSLREAREAIDKLNYQKYLGYSDWQIPHIEDLRGIVYCDKWVRDTTIIPSKSGGTKRVQKYCKSSEWNDPAIPTIDRSVFPTISSTYYGGYDKYLSSTVTYRNGNKNDISVWLLDFDKASISESPYVNKNTRGGRMPVIPVRYPKNGKLKINKKQ